MYTHYRVSQQIRLVHHNLKICHEIIFTLIQHFFSRNTVDTVDAIDPIREFQDNTSLKRLIKDQCTLCPPVSDWLLTNKSYLKTG